MLQVELEGATATVAGTASASILIEAVVAAGKGASVVEAAKVRPTGHGRGARGER